MHSWYIFSILYIKLKEIRWLTLHFAIYSRKSIYTGKGESVENQIEMCRQYIFSKFGTIADTDIIIYEDEGFSAKNTDRPKFQKMLFDIKNKKFDYVVCYRLDRISRNVSDFAMLIETLNNYDISFICIKEEFDTSKPMGKAMMYIASVFAQLERETIAERVRDNMLMLARTGRWLGGSAPTGFSSEKVEECITDGKIKTTYQLKFVSEEIEIVKQIQEKFLTLHSLSGVSKYCMKQNIKSRHGNYFSILSIKEILSNPVYCIADKEARNYFITQNSDVCFEEKDCSNYFGLLSYNKRDYTKKRVPRLPKSQWIIAIGKHQGIISGKKWVSIQSILENHTISSLQTKAHNSYALLSGFIRCKQCGHFMYAKTKSGNQKNKLYYYICQSKLCGGTSFCNSQNLNGIQTDTMVYEALKENTDFFPSDSRPFQKLKHTIKHTYTKNPLEKLEIKIKKYEEEIEKLLQLFTQCTLKTSLEQTIQTKLYDLEKELFQFNLEKEQLQKNSIEMDLKYTFSFETIFNTLSIEQKRSYIKLLVQKIEWDGENLELYLYKNSSFP